MVSFLLSFGVFAQEAVTTSAPEAAPVVAEEVVQEECAFKSMMKGKYGMRSHKWQNKSIGKVIVHKSIFSIFMLVFLFLGAFVIRKGWNLGGKK